MKSDIKVVENRLLKLEHEVKRMQQIIDELYRVSLRIEPEVRRRIVAIIDNASKEFTTTSTNKNLKIGGIYGKNSVKTHK